MEFIEKEVTTLWAGRAWLHGKYLNQATSANVPIIVKYKGARMTIQPEDFKARFDRKKEVEDKFTPGKIHNQYGVVFKKDDLSANKE